MFRQLVFFSKNMMPFSLVISFLQWPIPIQCHGVLCIVWLISLSLLCLHFSFCFPSLLSFGREASANPNVRRKARIKQARASAPEAPRSWTHANQWGVAETLVTAYKSVGKVIVAHARERADEVGETRGGNVLNALSTVASIHREVQSDCLDQWAARIRNGSIKSVCLPGLGFGPPSAKFLQLQLDSSPTLATKGCSSA